jgi:glycine oxidase
MSSDADLLVLGGGAIGLSVAWKASCEGFTVTLIDPAPGKGAMWAAAGMLASAAESHFGEEHHVALLSAASAQWSSFSQEIEAETGLNIGYEPNGTLVVGLDRGDRLEIERSIEFQRSLGHSVVDIDLEHLSEIEPALLSTISVAKQLKNDHHVDPRALGRALLFALKANNVSFCASSAESLTHSNRGVEVTLGNGTVRRGEKAVVALGTHTNFLETTAPLPQIRPIKGHILRLQGPVLLNHTIRGLVRGRSIYLVQRKSGEIVLGATVEEKGFDRTVRAGEVFRLLDDARRILPGVDELELVEAGVGLRPGSHDNAPVVEWAEEGRVLVATGHYRNGILLAPLTADLVVDMLQERHSPSSELFRSAKTGLKTT